MKIIITESQFEKILSSGKHKKALMNMIEDEGIYFTSKNFGVSYKDLIDEIFGEFDDEKVINLIKFYISDKLRQVYHFLYDCELYSDSNEFFNVVAESIVEYCYNNYYARMMDDDSMEFGNIWFRLNRYIELNYEMEIKDWYNKNCEK